MKKGGGRLKGNAFERLVASKIVEAFAEFGITKEDVFRTPSSGGHRYAKKSDPGDLVLSRKLEDLFRFSVECKHERQIDWGLYFRRWRDMPKTAQLKRWFTQAQEAADIQQGLMPLVVFQGNHTDIFCALREGAHTSTLDERFSSVGYLRVVAFSNRRPWRVYLFTALLGACVSIARSRNAERP